MSEAVLTARLHLVGDGISSGRQTNGSKTTDFLSHFWQMTVDLYCPYNTAPTTAITDMHQSTQRHSNTQETSGLSSLPSNTDSCSLPAFKRRFTSNVDCVNWLKCCCFGSRPSDHYFRSVCWFVCLFVQSFSQPSLIRFRSNYDIYYTSGSSCVP